MFHLSVPKGTNLILVTSACHGEGVSTVAEKLARGLNRNRRDTILVDCNLRPPKVEADPQGETAQQGLTEMVEDSLPAASVIYTDLGKQFSYIPAGRGTLNPISILTSTRFLTNLQSLRHKYRWTILAGPPVTTCPESADLGRIADAVILVVRAEHTRAEVIEQAKTTLERSGSHIAGAILNRRRYHIPASVYRWLT
jgi:Mrp family chromosome partitioning ATPase